MEDVVKNEWWEETIGDKPEKVHVDNKRKVRVQKSLLNGNFWTMICQPGRVDWNLEAVEKESDKTSELLALGAMSDNTLEPFVKIVRKWLGKCPSTNRLAFGADLGKVTNDIHTGCEEIQKYLHSIKLDPKNTTDFLYQINRPRKSKVDSNIIINRMNTWSVVSVSTGGVTINPTTSKISANVQNMYVCRLELDINTALSDNNIAKNKVYKVFQELVECGQEISDKGDV